MEVMIKLNAEEIREIIPYQLICETVYGARWDTGKRKRAYKLWFNEKERTKARKLFVLAHKWALSTGVPEEVTMSRDTLNLWNKLGMFCACEV